MHKKSVICHIRERSLLAGIAAYKLKSRQMAVTVGKTIHLWNTDRHSFLQDRKWVKHELCHVSQFQRYGILRFLVLYWVESLRSGYENNRFETEAREAEKQELAEDLPFEFR